MSKWADICHLIDSQVRKLKLLKIRKSSAMSSQAPRNWTSISFLWSQTKKLNLHVHTLAPDQARRRAMAANTPLMIARKDGDVKWFDWPHLEKREMRGENRKCRENWWSREKMEGKDLIYRDPISSSNFLALRNSYGNYSCRFRLVLISLPSPVKSEHGHLSSPNPNLVITLPKLRKLAKA